MNTIKETWSEIKPTTKEEKIKFVKTVGETLILAVILGTMLYFGCLIGG